MPSAENPVRGHRFKVSADGGLEVEVVVLADSSGHIHGITGANYLRPFIEDSNSAFNTRQAMAHRHEVPGVSAVRNADGSVTPVFSDKVANDMRFFSEATPCWFPECEQLRQRYADEVAAILQRDPNCPQCVLGGVKRKYLQLLSNIDTAPRSS